MKGCTDMFKGFKRFTAIMLALMLIFAFTACSSKTEGEKTGNDVKMGEDTKTIYPITIKDAFDRDVVIDKEPQKIISVAPNITEIIYALDLSTKLIGRSDYDDYPAEASSIESVGTMTDPSVEKIAAMKPDVVIASNFIKQELVQKLEDLGITVVALYGEESFEGAYETIGKVGEITNTTQKADEIIDGMKTKVAQVEEKVKGLPTPSVYYVVGFGEYGDYAAGKGTFVGNMIEMAGGKNAAGDMEGWKYSLEKLIQNNPDIMICSAYFGTKDGIKGTEGYKTLDAVKNDKLFEIDNNMLDRQGPRLADGFMELAKIIHPEAFK